MSSQFQLNSKLTNRSDPTIDELRSYYHSVSDEEREQVIQILGAMPQVDAARELIQLYYDCQWRNTKLQIIRSLAMHPHQRSLEFLFSIAINQVDIPLAEAAIWSLGQSHHRLAALFLIQFYEKCNEYLKPCIIGALGQIPDRTLFIKFLSELELALGKNQDLLAKNIILTLGELKGIEAVPLLHKIATQKNHPLSLSALVSIGKISRDPKIIENLEELFRNDLFEYQLFTSAKAQIQFRNQWKLEDYLAKLFQSPHFHPSLPFELNHFSPEDVLAGLSLFQGETNFERLCFVLSKLDFPQIADWYISLIDFKSLSPKKIELVLKSISYHHNVSMNYPLTLLKDCMRGNSLLWLEAVSYCFPNAINEFNSFFSSNFYEELKKEEKISAINSLFNYGLTVQADSQLLNGVAKILDQLLERESSKGLESRILRGFAFLKIRSKKASEVIKEILLAPPGESLQKDHSLIPSCLKYAELCPEKSFASILIHHIENYNKSEIWLLSFQSAILRTLSQYSHLSIGREPITTFLKMAFRENKGSETVMSALYFLRSHPQSTVLMEVLECLKLEEKIQISALITLKSFNDESTIEWISPFLNSHQKSLSGRALDTLIAFSSIRAKRIVIDYLKENCENVDVCEKVTRCFIPPESPSEYFVEVIDSVIKKSPSHPHLNGFLMLREKLVQSKALAKGKSRITSLAVEVEAIDRELLSKIVGYVDFEESIKTALRSAELPYLHRNLFDESVDKSVSVVEYCKAVDILLERVLGRKLLFPKLESHLHEFQNNLHAAGLGDEYPRSERVIVQAGLEKYFSLQTFPFYKITLVAQAIRNGKIISDHFKTLDGLRAWAVILLLFARKIQNCKPLIPVNVTSEEQIIDFSKRLMLLQDVRNPLAHRQTVVKFPAIEEVRSETFALMSLIKKIF